MSEYEWEGQPCDRCSTPYSHIVTGRTPIEVFVTNESDRATYNSNGTISYSLVGYSNKVRVCGFCLERLKQFITDYNICHKAKIEIMRETDLLPTHKW
jgi:hypothetical protein